MMEMTDKHNMDVSFKNQSLYQSLLGILLYSASFHLIKLFPTGFIANTLVLPCIMGCVTPPGEARADAVVLVSQMYSLGRNLGSKGPSGRGDDACSKISSSNMPRTMESVGEFESVGEVRGVPALFARLLSRLLGFLGSSLAVTFGKNCLESSPSTMSPAVTVVRSLSRLRAGRVSGSSLDGRTLMGCDVDLCT